MPERATIRRAREDKRQGTVRRRSAAQRSASARKAARTRARG